MADKGSTKPRKTFLRRLLHDKSANTLAIGAAAIFPLIGVIGGGVDASRMYLAQSRLQQACDSATLAARKKLGGSTIAGGSIPTDIVETADNFFETNFSDGIYGTSDTSYELTSSVGTRMDGTAETSVPVTLMSVFGFDEIELAVDCSADLNLPNIDVSLVLDMSGSMSSATDGVTRMDALKAAVFAFYDRIMAVAPADARVRLAIVPYNSNIRVGQMLHTLNPAYLADSHDYQTREAIWESVMTDPGSPAVPAVPGTPGTDDSEELYSDQRELVTREKSWLGSNYWWYYRWSSNQNHSSYGRAACDNMDGTYTVGGERWVITDDDYYSNYFSSGHSSARGGCVARVRKYRVVAGEPGTPGTPAIPAVPPTFEDVFQRYEYKEMNLDTSSFKTFASTGMPVGYRGANVNSTWNGCIEEATTVPATTFNPIPAGAYDMDIDLVPDPANVNTQWRPQWNRVTFDRGGQAQVDSTGDLPLKSGTCPAQTYPLTEYPLNGTLRNSDFTNRINAMTATGGTMHDIGMIWGGRVLSPNGIFAGTNATAPNGDPIIRHLIFMTDGEMGANPNWQIAYGNPDMDGHLAGFKGAGGSWTEDELAVIHNARLEAVCQQIKNKNITIWSVAFTLDHSPETKGCASGNSRALKATDQSTLITNFETIATSIAELRLVN